MFTNDVANYSKQLLVTLDCVEIEVIWTSWDWNCQCSVFFLLKCEFQIFFFFFNVPVRTISRKVLYNSHLCSIHSSAENLEALNLITSSSWIGFNDITTESQFVWNDGTAVDYSNWNSGEPNQAGNEDCTEFVTNGQWNDKICSTCRHLLCNSAPTLSPTETPTNTPTNLPINTPTNSPLTSFPTIPSILPTNTPTNLPTVPTNAPTNIPTFPTNSPTNSPTNLPTVPTNSPSNLPTNSPSNSPTNSPTNSPSNLPTYPSNAPTNLPSNSPTAILNCIPVTIYNQGCITWAIAEAYCQETYNSHLCSIHSSAQNFEAMNLIEATSWIGFNDLIKIDFQNDVIKKKRYFKNAKNRSNSPIWMTVILKSSLTEGQFVWNDGTPSDYTNWDDDEPNNTGNEHCVEIYTDGT